MAMVMEKECQSRNPKKCRFNKVYKFWTTRSYKHVTPNIDGPVYFKWWYCQPNWSSENWKLTVKAENEKQQNLLFIINFGEFEELKNYNAEVEKLFNEGMKSFEIATTNIKDKV